MEYQLTEVLGIVPDDIFFNEKGDPDFNSIFVEVARIIYGEGGVDFSIPVHDFVTKKLPNLSSFQRSVAKERQRRVGGSTARA
jgi:hypothetical protein